MLVNFNPNCNNQQFGIKYRVKDLFETVSERALFDSKTRVATQEHLLTSLTDVDIKSTDIGFTKAMKNLGTYLRKIYQK